MSKLIKLQNAAIFILPFLFLGSLFFLKKDCLAEDNPTNTARFLKDTHNIITDTKTGLQWYVGPEQKMDWETAQKWAKNLVLDGGGWRVPELEEFTEIFQENVGKCNLDPLFSIDCEKDWIWSINLCNSFTAQGYYFVLGSNDCFPVNTSRILRVMAVREAKKPD